MIRSPLRSPWSGLYWSPIRSLLKSDHQVWSAWSGLYWSPIRFLLKSDHLWSGLSTEVRWGLYSSQITLIRSLLKSDQVYTEVWSPWSGLYWSPIRSLLKSDHLDQVSTQVWSTSIRSPLRSDQLRSGLWSGLIRSPLRPDQLLIRSLIKSDHRGRSSSRPIRKLVSKFQNVRFKYTRFGSTTLSTNQNAR